MGWVGAWSVDIVCGTGPVGRVGLEGAEGAVVIGVAGDREVAPRIGGQAGEGGLDHHLRRAERSFGHRSELEEELRELALEGVDRPEIDRVDHALVDHFVEKPGCLGR